MEEIIKVFSKLVRGKIPHMIEAERGNAKTIILSDDVYIKELDKKLNEE